MGHTDTLVIGDIGLPVPPGVPCIDLAVTAGVPTFTQVFEAILAELAVEAVTFAGEIHGHNDAMVSLGKRLAAEGLTVNETSHALFKQQCAKAVAIHSVSAFPSGGTVMKMPLVTMRGIHKAFGPVKVLEGVDFELLPGEVHALMGENGAGKSTLMKVLTGVHKADAGTIEVDGLAVSISSTTEAEKHGIAIIHQELNLIPHLSVTENLFLGRELNTLGLLHRRAMRQRASARRASAWRDRSSASTRHHPIRRAYAVAGDLAPALVSSPNAARRMGVHVGTRIWTVQRPHPTPTPGIGIRLQ
ncbi:MAG: hypothetical protein WDW38_006542 [Sanguina aurantia]